MKDFKKNRILYGIIKDDKNTIENIRCEVQLNRIDTSNLKAEFYDTEGTVGTKFMCHFLMKDVQFVSLNEHDQVKIDGSVSQGKISNDSDLIGTLSINKYEELYRIHSNQITTISFLFFITPTSIFMRHRIRVSHDMKGLLFGYKKFFEDEPEKWEEEATWYESKVGKICIYPGLIFSEEVDGSFVVRDQPKILVKVSGNDLDYQQLITKVNEVIGNYLHILSLLENKSVDWYYCETDGRGESGKGFIGDIYKRIPKCEYRDDQYLQQHSEHYKSILPVIVDRYINLQLELKDDLDKVIFQMLVASRPEQTLDTELVYWHSSLDILIKILLNDKYERLGFSKRLVYACKENNIQWEDLYPYISEPDIFSNEQPRLFKITEFRNRMIHDGVYPKHDQYNEVFEENARAATLGERMIMHVLGLEIKDTPLGKFRKFR